MKAFIKMYLVEIMKLRRTLALGMVFIAPLVVVTLQVFIWLNNRDLFGADIDLWLAFINNVLSMWAVFMQPLYIALVIALIYGIDHSSQGWLRMHSLPIPRWSIPAAKVAVVLTMVAAAMIVLVGASLAGVLLSASLNPRIDLHGEIPMATIALRSARVLAASLIIVAIQNFVSFRWSSMTVSLGVGIAGTFLALFAGRWKYGPYYPWMMPILTLHANDEVVARILWLGPLTALILAAATLIYATRREPGLYH